MLDELDWMDDITRKKAHTKVDKMMPFIGYAKEILDDKLINDHYRGESTILFFTFKTSLKRLKCTFGNID